MPTIALAVFACAFILIAGVFATFNVPAMATACGICGGLHIIFLFIKHVHGR